LFSEIIEKSLLRRALIVADAAYFRFTAEQACIQFVILTMANEQIAEIPSMYRLDT